MKLLIIAAVISIAGIQCSNQAHAQALVVNSAGIAIPTTSVSSYIYIDQIGDNNSINITQQGDTHTAKVTMGSDAPVTNNVVSIDQRDPGRKYSAVDIPSGINNGINITQQGTGQHSSAIMGLNGDANNISIAQDGAGNHTFNILFAPGTANSANTINATQSGGAGADKSFNLNMNGTVGANVTVQQTNPTQSNSGSMSITCTTGSCGSYSYIRQ
jgi:hypothetical protein